MKGDQISSGILLLEHAVDFGFLITTIQLSRGGSLSECSSIFQSLIKKR